MAEDAVATTAIGTVTATVASGEAITYTITAGNTGSAFAIGATSGELTVAAALDATTTASYALTVRASVGSGDDLRTATTTVTLTVQGAPPAPANLAAGTATATSVPVSWDAVPGAAKYRVEYRDTSADEDPGTWTVDDETLTTTTHTVDELDCGTAYAFQVTAFGDQVRHTAAWGTPATAVPATTTACLPTFGDDAYAFTVVESADVDAEVGPVLATDPAGGSVTHAITAGNTGNAFTIHETTGVLTVAAALDYLTTASYTLTVQATSAAGSSDATVTITVTGVDCANGTVVADPRDHAALVGDCRVLLAALEGLEGDGGREIQGGGSLNWSETLALASWEGVSSSGTPSRVTGLDLSDKSLGGTIPTGLGGLTALTTLDLERQRSRRQRPDRVERAHQPDHARAQWEQPEWLCPRRHPHPGDGDHGARAATHDIASLSLPYCDAHAPVPSGGVGRGRQHHQRDVPGTGPPISAPSPTGWRIARPARPTPGPSTRRT